MISEKKFCHNCLDESAEYDDPFCKKCNNAFYVVTSDKNPVDSDYFYSLFNKADMLQTQQKYEKALECYDTLLEINNHNIRALLGKAMCYADMENESQAIYYLDQAIAINFNSISEDYLNISKKIALCLGFDLMEEKKYDKAIIYFDKILAIDENFKDAITFKNYCIEFKNIP